MDRLTDRTPLARGLYAALGVVSMTLGLVGVFVPGLPTTVFVIVASYLFARSSPRLERWLESHPLLGPPLRQFRETGGMPRRRKGLALASMWTGIGLSVLVLDQVLVRLIIVALGLAGTATILFVVRTTEPRQLLILP